MPELLGGMERQPESFPVPYIDANIPQAWAAGVMLWLVGSMLGLSADAPNHQLIVQPALPAWLPDIRLTNIAVGDAKVDLRFWRDGDQTQGSVLKQTGALTVSTRDRANGKP